MLPTLSRLNANCQIRCPPGLAITWCHLSTDMNQEHGRHTPLLGGAGAAAFRPFGTIELLPGRAVVRALAKCEPGSPRPEGLLRRRSRRGIRRRAQVRPAVPAGRRLPEPASLVAFGRSQPNTRPLGPPPSVHPRLRPASQLNCPASTRPDGDILEDGDVVPVRGCDLDPDVLRADAARHRSPPVSGGIEPHRRAQCD
jgi:hypothetical protein